MAFQFTGGLRKGADNILVYKWALRGTDSISVHGWGP